MITDVIVGAITLKCDRVSKPKKTVIARDVIPGSTEECVQKVASYSRDIELSGILIGANKETDRTTLLSYEGEEETYNDGEDVITMLVTDVDIPTEGGSPSHYRFTIKGIKV